LHFRDAPEADIRSLVGPALLSIERYNEEGRERFLTSEELARLGDVLRKAETIGLPYDVDETKPTAKHAPKRENRRRKMDPEFSVATPSVCSDLISDKGHGPRR
jgi:hypothetical protein